MTKGQGSHTLPSVPGKRKHTVYSAVCYPVTETALEICLVSFEMMQEGIFVKQ